MLATQKPTVDVITGLIKSNLPARIAFQVASRTDSRVVLDEMGADKLLGNGDMLFLWPGTSTLLRGQGTYVSDDEISRVIGAVATTEPQFVKELVQLKTATRRRRRRQETFSDRDELYEAAIDIVVREGRGSVSLLQRSLGIGYGRAARLVDFMAEDGIVGAYNGSQAREILLTVEQWEQMTGQNSTEAPEPPTPRRANKIRLASDDGANSPGKVRTVKPVPDSVDSDDEHAAEDEEPPFDDDEDVEDEAEDIDEDQEYEEEEELDDQQEADPEDDGSAVPKPVRRQWKAESA